MEILAIDDSTVDIPGLASIPWFGEIFFQQPWVVYAGVALAVCVGFILQKTRHGLSIRAIGEDPGSAHAAVVSVRLWQTVYVTCSGALMGLGGAVLSVVIAGSFQPGMTAGRGFVALAAVICVGWRPWRLIWASYLFGILIVLNGVGQSQGWDIPPEFLSMAPYILTTVAVIAYARLARYSARAPASLGIPFVPGEK